jgi:hypothetical protein
MRIPSGDLAPARRHRRHGSSFRRRRRRWPVVLAVVAVVAVAAGSYWLRRDNSTAGTLAGASPCPSPASSAAASPAAPLKAATPVRLPAPGQVSLRLLNGTGRDKLALAVGNELARRGFRVTAMGNAPRPLAGASRVYYGPTGRPAALLVTAHVPGATVQPVPTAARGALDVVLGSTFVRLRTPAEVTAYARQLTTSGVPAAAGSPKPVATAACR